VLRSPQQSGCGLIPEADPIENLAAEMLKATIQAEGGDAWRTIESNPLLSCAWQYFFPRLDPRVVIGGLVKRHRFAQTLRISRNLNL